jgi:hypothetical protein
MPPFGGTKGDGSRPRRQPVLPKRGKSAKFAPLREQSGESRLMRLAAVALARNECDIIESFVRHNVALLDHLYILDNGSNDATPAILDKLAAEGLPITWTLEHSEHQQGRKTTVLVERALNDHPYDFLFPLDCDEFLQVRDRALLEALVAQIPKGAVGYLENVDYVPTPSDQDDEIDAVRRIVHVAITAPPRAPKVFKLVIPAAVAQRVGFLVGEGTHSANIGGKSLPQHRLQSANIAHFPVRSIDQFVSKVVIGRLAWLTRPDFNPDWARHFGKFYDELRVKPSLSAQDLQEAALFYVDKNFHPSPFQFDMRRPYQIILVRAPMTARYSQLRFTDLINVAALPRILDAVQSLAEQLQAARAGSDAWRLRNGLLQTGESTDYRALQRKMRTAAHKILGRLRRR